MALPVAIVWLVNAAAFWLAEILTSPTPRDAEPAWVLAVALAGYLALGAAGAALSRLIVPRTRARAVLSERWIAFIPGALLLFPVVRYALGVEPRETALLLALLATATAVLALAWRRVRVDDAWTAGVAYGCGSLALWSIALSSRTLAADVPLVAPTITASSWTVPWAVGALSVVALALAVVPAGMAPLGIAALAIVAGRFVVPSWVGPPSHV